MNEQTKASCPLTSTNVLVFDVETSTHNKGHPFDPRNMLVSYAYRSPSDTNFKYHSDPDFRSDLRNRVECATVVVGFNIKFDLHWFRNVFGEIPQDVKVWDCQLAEFVYSGQETSFASLNEVLETYGLPTKKDIIKEYWDQGISTEDIPLHVLREYNEWDVHVTKLLFDLQQTLLSEKQKQLVWLEGEDLKALQAAEWAGIRFDAEKAAAKTMEVQSKVDGIVGGLSDFLPAGIPEDGYNWNSGDHLSALLYGGTIGFPYAVETETTYKSGPKKGESYIARRWHSVEIEFTQRFKPLDGTEIKKTAGDPTAKTRFYQTDGPTLAQLKTRLAENRRLLALLAERAKLIKVVEMIESLQNTIAKKNWQNNMLHGQFNQNVAVTGRLSSSGPNLQNTPPEVDALLVSRYAS